jgi:hypothetical protein
MGLTHFAIFAIIVIVVNSSLVTHTPFAPIDTTPSSNVRIRYRDESVEAAIVIFIVGAFFIIFCYKTCYVSTETTTETTNEAYLKPPIHQTTHDNEHDNGNVVHPDQKEKSNYRNIFMNNTIATKDLRYAVLNREVLSRKKEAQRAQLDQQFSVNSNELYKKMRNEEAIMQCECEREHTPKREKLESGVAQPVPVISITLQKAKLDELINKVCEREQRDNE